jgi:ketose-bisphosphate aldolase
MLVSLGPLLEDAERDGYAVGSFNVFNMETIMGVVDAVTSRRSPAVIAITRRHVPLIDLEGLAAMVKLASTRTDVPIALHLDHATDVVLIERALAAGFTSVMYDGSSLRMAERIGRTREVVDLAHQSGASAEAELEHMGRLGVEEDSGPTDPRAAADFAAATGVDVLAVAIGNVHGSIGADIRLDLDRLAAIRANVTCHLSLHGGSGIPADQLAAAIGAGITKVSLFHRLAEAALGRLQANVFTTPAGEIADLTAELRHAFADQCSSILDVLGSAERCRP